MIAQSPNLESPLALNSLNALILACRPLLSPIETCSEQRQVPPQLPIITSLLKGLQYVYRLVAFQLNIE